MVCKSKEKELRKAMKIIVISNQTIIREGIVAIISKHDSVSVEFVGQRIEEAMPVIKADIAEVMLLDINKDNEKEINVIENLRELGLNTKILVVDFYGDKNLFIKSLKCGVKGYILGKSTEEEIMYAIEQVNKGKKYFDSYFVDNMINENNELPNRLELLTVREREILVQVASGLSNGRISEKFSITEFTVKKHITHIFEKLGISDRSEVAGYIKTKRL